MNVPIIRQWIEALRSGKYKQTIGALRDANGCHCALGVLCDVYDPSRWYRKGACNFYYYAGNAGMVPTWLANAVGMSMDQLSQYSRLNDHGTPFRQIAYYLESLLPAE